MPATCLRCRKCGTRARPRRGRRLRQVLGPARARLRPRRAPPAADPRADRRRPALALALRRAPAGGDPGRAEARARPDPARQRAPARRGDRAARALPQARHGEPDPLLQGPRRRGRMRQGAGARTRHARLLLDREPGRRRRSAGRRRGARGCGLLPRRPRAREAAADGRIRRDDLRGARQLRRLQPPDRRALVRAPVGVRQRRPPLLLRGGLEDGRVRDRRAARLGAARRGRRPRRLGRAARQDRARLRRAARARPRRAANRPGSSAPRRRGAPRWPPRSATRRR